MAQSFWFPCLCVAGSEQIEQVMPQYYAGDWFVKLETLASRRLVVCSWMALFLVVVCGASAGVIAETGNFPQPSGPKGLEGL